MADLATLQARLARLETLIAKIEESNTQEHWTGGTDRHRSPELSRLYDERRMLDDQIAALDGSSASFQRISVIE